MYYVKVIEPLFTSILVYNLFQISLRAFGRENKHSICN